MFDLHFTVTVIFVVLALTFDGTKSKFDFTCKMGFIAVAAVLTVQLAQQHI